nr:MAG TPA: hypothetical protein [Caudoviricetes sp.]
MYSTTNIVSFFVYFLCSYCNPKITLCQYKITYLSIFFNVYIFECYVIITLYPLHNNKLEGFYEIMYKKSSRSKRLYKNKTCQRA